MGLLSATITKHNSYRTINKAMFPRKIPPKIESLKISLGLRTRHHKKGLPKEDSQTILKKAFLIEVVLEVLVPAESLLLVCKQTRLGT